MTTRGDLDVGDDRHRRAVWSVTALAGAFAYGWWLTGLEPFAWPSTVAVSIPAVAMIVAATRRDVEATPLRDWITDIVRTCRRATASTRTGERCQARAAVLWGIVIVSFVALQLFAYFAGWSAPRHEYPTLSWIVDHVGTRAGRTVLFVAWLVFGGWLVRR
jgi:hypothetical protein